MTVAELIEALSEQDRSLDVFVLAYTPRGEEERFAIEGAQESFRLMDSFVELTI